jgi:glycosyltransferase involved in cell wall biosynthesis
LPELVAGCRAFLMPNVEDFGIAAVEAMAAGRPVIALGQGGALDTVRDLDRWRAGQLPGSLGPTGLLYSHSDANSLAKAVRRFERESRHFDPDDAAVWARQFDQTRFEQEIIGWLTALLDGGSSCFG